MKHHRVSTYITNQYKPETNHNESSHIIPNTTKRTQGSRDQSENNNLYIYIYIHIKNGERGQHIGPTSIFKRKIAIIRNQEAHNKSQTRLTNTTAHSHL